MSMGSSVLATMNWLWLRLLWTHGGKLIWLSSVFDGLIGWLTSIPWSVDSSAMVCSTFAIPLLSIFLNDFLDCEIISLCHLLTIPDLSLVLCVLLQVHWNCSKMSIRIFEVWVLYAQINYLKVKRKKFLGIMSLNFVYLVCDPFCWTSRHFKESCRLSNAHLALCRGVNLKLHLLRIPKSKSN